MQPVRFGDSGQRFLISARRVSDGKRVDVIYFGEPVDQPGLRDPDSMFVAARVKEMFRSINQLSRATTGHDLYKDPEIIDRKLNQSGKLRMDDA